VLLVLENMSSLLGYLLASWSFLYSSQVADVADDIMLTTEETKSKLTTHTNNDKK